MAQVEVKIKENINSKGQIIGSIPVGTIIPTIISTIPSGWLECNGSEVIIGSSGSTYYALSQQLGTTYGALTNGSGAAGSTHFKLPNLKSSYLIPKVSTDNVNSGGLNGHQHLVTATATSATNGNSHNHNISQTGTGGDYIAHNHAGGNTYAGVNGSNPPNANKTGTGGSGTAGGAAHTHDASCNSGGTNWWSNIGAYSNHNITSLGINASAVDNHSHTATVSGYSTNVDSFPQSYVVRYLIKV